MNCQKKKQNYVKIMEFIPTNELTQVKQLNFIDIYLIKNKNA